MTEPTKKSCKRKPIIVSVGGQRVKVFLVPSLKNKKPREAYKLWESECIWYLS